MPQNEAKSRSQPTRASFRRKGRTPAPGKVYAGYVQFGEIHDAFSHSLQVTGSGFVSFTACSSFSRGIRVSASPAVHRTDRSGALTFFV
jgi:hypothetical protein